MDRGNDASSSRGAVSAALAADPRDFLERMYGDRPDRWSEELRGMDRLRFAINALTRMRVCTAEGRIDVKMKGPPNEARLPYRPWFEHEARLAATCASFSATGRRSA